MSFILDALKKSESERQRQAAPGLLESSFAPARASTPRWVIALLALFAANLAVVGAILLHRPAPTRPEEPAAGPAATAPTLPRSSGTPSLAPPAPSAPTTVGSTETGPPNPLATEVSPVLAPEVPVDQSENPIVQAARRHAAAAPPAAPRAGGAGGAGGSATAGAPSFAALPTLAQMRFGDGESLPPLHLDVHVYSTDPAQRFVFINGRRYVEGMRLREGPLLRRIRPDGVELDYRGQAFLLPRS